MSTRQGQMIGIGFEAESQPRTLQSLHEPDAGVDKLKDVSNRKHTLPSICTSDHLGVTKIECVAKACTLSIVPAQSSSQAGFLMHVVTVWVCVLGASAYRACSS